MSTRSNVLLRCFSRPALAVAAALALGSCAAPPKPKAPTYSERVILLPNQDGRRSAVIVTRPGGEQQIARPFEALELSGAREQRIEYAQGEIEQRYRDVLSAQPGRPFTYKLYFNTATTEFSAQSRAAWREVRQKIEAFPAAQVTVSGHTDRVDTPEANDGLSLKRAAAIRELLILIGIPRQASEVVGRGERELLIQTADGVAEECNRRVEIKLR